MVVIINPYKHGSRGAKRLKNALSLKGLKSFVMQKEPTNPRALIINWGNSDWIYDPKRLGNIVNDPSFLGFMTNKLRFFRHVGHEKIVPEWATEPADALKWGSRVVARTVLEGSGGAGIVIWDPEQEKPDELVRAPLYVKYEAKTHEYRIHMARGLRGTGFYPLLVQRKIFQKGEGLQQPLSWEVRNHKNGFVYVQNSGYPTPDCVVAVAEEFMNKHFPGLHFAALDVIFHEKKNCAYILEGNTAPGLEGNTIEVYTEYFQSLAKEANGPSKALSG